MTEATFHAKIVQTAVPCQLPTTKGLRPTPNLSTPNFQASFLWELEVGRWKLEFNRGHVSGGRHRRHQDAARSVCRGPRPAARDRSRRVRDARLRRAAA